MNSDKLLICKTILFGIILLFLISCSNKNFVRAKQYNFKNTDSIINYGNLNFWAAHPYKKDLSDSVPDELKKDYKQDSSIDIFFLHPTTYTQKEKTFSWNAPVDDALLDAKTDYSTILYQASVFNNAGRVFAPRYRQAHISAYYPITKEDTTASETAFEKAYEDIKQAFVFYLKHWNKGKPIIIASHSQGTTHAIKLLKEFFDGKELQQQLVAAYLVGIPVNPLIYTSIRACKSPAETGCICSWRTFKEGYIPEYINQEKFTAIVTNPITWDAIKPAVSRKENPGSVLKNFNKIIPKVAGAKIEKGVLWTEKPHFFGSFLLKTSNYHIADYNFYYLSIRRNVSERIAAYKNKALLKSKARL